MAGVRMQEILVKYLKTRGMNVFLAGLESGEGFLGKNLLTSQFLTSYFWSCKASSTYKEHYSW